MPMITCKEFLSLLDKFLDMEVSDTCKRIEIRVHLDNCEACQDEYVNRKNKKDIEERGY